MNDEQTQSFIDKYRDAIGKQYESTVRDLERQRDLAYQDLDNARRNQFQRIMGAANTAGMMYSSFPETSKIQYNTETYMPARTQIRNSYQTGLDKLRSNIVSAANSLADYKDEIASLNKQASGSALPSGSAKLNSAGDYAHVSLIDGTQFYNANKEKIKFGTALKRANITDSREMLRQAEKVFSQAETLQLKDILEKGLANGMTGFTYNTGANYVEPSYNFLTPEQNAFLGRLGLGFGS